VLATIPQFFQKLTASPVNVLEKTVEGESNDYPYLYRDETGTPIPCVMKFYNGKDGDGKPIPVDSSTIIDLDEYFAFECSFQLVGGNNKDDVDSRRPVEGDYAEVTLPSGVTFANVSAIEDKTITADGDPTFEIGTLHVAENTAKLTFSEDVWNNDVLAISASFGAELDTKSIQEKIEQDSTTFELLGNTITVKKDLPDAVSKMEKSGSVDNSTGTISWSLDVTPTEDGLAGVTVTDTLTSDSKNNLAQSFTENFLTVGSLASGTDYTATYDSSSKQLKIVFADTEAVKAVAKPLCIQFKTQIVDFAYYNAVDFSFTNQALAKKGDDFDPVESNIATVTGTTPNLITKTLTKQEKDTAGWQITINPSGNRYPGAYVVDKLPDALNFQEASYTFGEKSGTFSGTTEGANVFGAYKADGQDVTFYLGDLSGTDPIVINYTTKIDQGVADQTVSSGKELANQAALYWTIDGSGTSPDHTKWVGVSLPIAYADITKSAGKLDTKTGELPWTINVTAYDGTVSNAKVTEVFLCRKDGALVDQTQDSAIRTAFFEELDVDADAVRNDLRYGGGTDHANTTDKVSFAYNMQYVDSTPTANTNTNTVNFTAGVLKYTAQIVTFDLGKITASAGGTATQTIKVETKVPAAALYALVATNGVDGITISVEKIKEDHDFFEHSCYKSRTLVNYARLIYGDYGAKTANATKAIAGRFFEKKNGNVKVDESGVATIPWIFIVNDASVELGTVTVTDPLDDRLAPAFLEYDGKTYAFKDGEFENTPDGWTASYDEATNKVTVEIQNVTQKFSFVLATALDTMTQSDSGDLSSFHIYNNGYLSYNSQINTDWQDVNIEKRGTLLTKTGKTQAGKVVWTIEVNSGALNLTNLKNADFLTLTDMMGPNQKVDSVEVNGESYTDYTIAEKPTVEGGMDLVFKNLSPSEAYEIVITTDAADDIKEVINTAKLEGLKKTIITKEITTQTAASSGSGAVSRGGTLMVFKHGSEAPDKVLTGVTLELWNAGNTRKVADVTYNEEMNCYTADGLSRSAYVLKETGAPSGYQNSQNDAIQNVTVDEENKTTDVPYAEGLKGWEISFNAKQGANVDIYDDLLTSDLSISKKLQFNVDGSAERTNEQMTFVFQVTAADPSRLVGNRQYDVDDGTEKLSFDNGVATVNVTSGKTVTIHGLPVGQYTVTETGILKNGDVCPLNLSDYSRTTTWTCTANGGTAVSGNGPIAANVKLAALTITEPTDGINLGTPLTVVAFTNMYDRTTGGNSGGGTDNDPPDDGSDNDVPDNDVPDNDVPLSPVPADPGSTPDTRNPQTPRDEIPDDGVPLAEAPATGDNLLVWLVVSGMSGLALVCVGKRFRKRENSVE
jgi:hypothetical protein